MNTTSQAPAGAAIDLLTPTKVDAVDLEQRVKSRYKAVAENPHDEFHFEMGRAMAERLGYPADALDYIPSAAIDSFAGVGYYFHYANLNVGENVIDLGSVSGMDTFFAAQQVGKNCPRGRYRYDRCATGKIQGFAQQERF
jgi:arsenite methyltransferase